MKSYRYEFFGGPWDGEHHTLSGKPYCWRIVLPSLFAVTFQVEPLPQACEMRVGEYRRARFADSTGIPQTCYQWTGEGVET